MNNSQYQKETAKTLIGSPQQQIGFRHQMKKDKIDGWKNQLNCIPFASNEQEHR